MTKTQFRPLTVITLFVTLFVLGSNSFVLLEDKFWIEQDIKQIIFDVIALIILIVVIIILIKQTVIIHFDKKNKKIKFHYIFLLTKHEYEFKEIKGFRFFYISGKISLKGLQIKTQNEKKYSVTDFGIKNLREFEKLFLQFFELNAATELGSRKEFKKITDKGKKREIIRSEKFDKEQKNEIVIYLYIASTFLLLVLSIMIYFTKSFNDIITPVPIFVILLIYFSIKTIIKT